MPRMSEERFKELKLFRSSVGLGYPYPHPLFIECMEEIIALRADVEAKHNSALYWRDEYDALMESLTDF